MLSVLERWWSLLYVRKFLFYTIALEERWDYNPRIHLMKYNLTVDETNIEDVVQPLLPRFFIRQIINFFGLSTSLVFLSCALQIFSFFSYWVVLVRSNRWYHGMGCTISSIFVSSTVRLRVIPNTTLVDFTSISDVVLFSGEKEKIDSVILALLTLLMSRF
jgi:hypothetical protein